VEKPLKKTHMMVNTSIIPK